ncbi:tetratricopeptide repeat protein [Alicycliphilus denitrificans]|uniref:protein O-GlcNAc transferase n=2 Tax=Alicycliphilus denitrificans TaxID=179636 RepID=A0A858ZP90_9BURK|nr:Tetratricopeptide TPR_1 repeat-containing protein [Alicycliphilus denitrificans BC]QKD42645.1 tetratricopeptide repeat protein [Alicycliphilus denitrificans]GAO26210.1 tetratricopeptide repeat-containing protein [Alicycliphilus sp. B1]
MTDSKKPNFNIRFQSPAVPAPGFPSAGVSFRVPTMQPPEPALPDDAQACNTQGNTWLQANRVADAIKAYDRAIALQADYLDPHFNRGNALLRLGRKAEALTAFERAIALAPGLALAHYNRATVLEGMGREQESMDSYRQVLCIEPGHVQAQFNLGCLHLRRKAYGEAVACMDRVLALEPRLAQAHNNRGNALLKSRHLLEAVASFDQALALQPQYADALVNRGNARLQRKEHAQAFADLDRAIRLNPDQAQSRQLMGTLLRDSKRHEEALQEFQRAWRCNPGQPGLLTDILGAKTAVCDWHNIGAGIDRLGQAVAQRQPGVSPFSVAVLCDDPALQLQAARNFVAADYPENPLLGPVAPRADGGRIRVGYYSADFHHHATAILMAELFELHDRERFEWFAFSFGPDSQDAMHARVRQAFDHFLDVRDRSDEAVARLSRELGIDIAVDLKGFTQDTRFGIFSYRCAPVQVSYLGYPGTTGADYIDYAIADKVVLPPQARCHFSEKVVYLPHSYQVNDSKRRIADRAFTREALGLPATGFVFCCFNNNYKILPQMLDGWGRILHAVEDSVLWLLEDNPAVSRNLLREAQARGIAPQRLVFAQRMPLDEHLARHRLADLFLDTLPCNAHTTASDALWAGLPVLTCAGQSFASRVAASLLHAVGLPELVTETQGAYEARAIALARDAGQLDALRSRLHAQAPASPLFDARRFARDLEAAYVVMHARAVQGLPPEAFKV